MRLSLLTVTGLLALASADFMDVVEYCADQTGGCKSTGWWNTCCGVYTVNPQEGCRGGNVPSLKEFCMDWGKGRMHFFFNGQGKRCMVRTDRYYYIAPDCNAQNCYKSRWEERACTW